MKKVLLSVFSVFIFSGIPAASPDSLILAGNKYYTENDYQKATEAYKAVIEKGLTAPELYFNLGNAYYKMNNYALAILYYEKALVLEPNDKDINFNLELANAHVIDKIDIIPEFFLKKWIREVGYLFHSDTWAILSITFFVLFLALLLLFLSASRLMIKKVSLYFLIISLFISLTGFCFAAQRRLMIIKRDKAIIIAPSVTAKSSPNEYGTNLFILHEGTKVEIVDNLSNWIEIKLSNGNKGWIQNSALEKI